MGRKKKAVVESQDLLAAQSPPSPQPSPPGEGEAPAILEYTPMDTGDRWRVEKYELLIAEVLMVGIQEAGGHEKAMALFHEMALRQTRGWLICRRLFGICPVIPPADAHPDDLHPSTREQLCQTLGLEAKELQAELDALRVMWGEFLKREVSSEQSAVSTPEEKPKEELAFGDEVLRECGFDSGMFEVVTWNPVTKTDELRAATANRIERDWFCRRVGEWKKMLDEPVAGALAREALMNELYLRRFGQEMAVLGPSSLKWRQLYESKRQVEIIYEGQLASLQTLFPEMAVAGKISFRAVISDLNKAHRDYYGRQDRRLVDKLMTATEIEVMLRMSAQSPQPRYRLGLNIFLVEGFHNLYDPNFRSQFKPQILKRLDEAFRNSVMAAREAQNEPLVDMEEGVIPGEGSDFPDLNEPAEETVMAAQADAAARAEELKAKAK